MGKLTIRESFKLYSQARETDAYKAEHARVTRASVALSRQQGWQAKAEAATLDALHDIMAAMADGDRVPRDLLEAACDAVRHEQAIDAVVTRRNDDLDQAVQRREQVLDETVSAWTE